MLIVLGHDEQVFFNSGTDVARCLRLADCLIVEFVLIQLHHDTIIKIRTRLQRQRMKILHRSFLMSKINRSCFGPLFVFLLLLSFLKCSQQIPPDSSRIEIVPDRFHAVRFDPSYYYDTEFSVKELSRMLARRWRESGMNTVYLKVYDPIHGAVYRTEYSMNVQTDYGLKDLLKDMLKACHAEGIRVFGWIPAFEHKQVWDSHPEWRVKRQDDADYKPTEDSHFLCVRQSGFREWWLGFVGELLEHYKDLDGIDVGEPIIAWNQSDGCFCDECRSAFERSNTQRSSDPDAFNFVRSEPLTSLLEETCRLIHSHGKSSSITTVLTPYGNGRLFSPVEQRALTGFDLDAVLDSPDRPHILNGELIWQQWASLYGDTVVFAPEWTERATTQLTEQVRHLSHLVVHIELTPLGNVQVSESQFLRSLTSAFDGGAMGIDFYDAFQADNRALWPKIAETMLYVPTKKAVIYYDADTENDARQVQVLLRHFRVEAVLLPVEDSFSPADVPDAEFIFYLGVNHRSALPEAFMHYLSSTDKTVCWLNHNIEYLGDALPSEFGFRHEALEEHVECSVAYKGSIFPKADSLLHIIRVEDADRCEVIATATTPEGTVPYVVRSGRFWYFADLPTNYVIEGGRHIVFADLLHDILGQDHREKHLALVRIEDVNPMSDPKALRDIANYLGSQNVPFTVGLTPLYLDPATNTTVSLSEVPKLTKAIRHMVSKGGTVALHGCTHQYRGQTTDDYEFWDGFRDGPIFQDSEGYVRERIDRALKECFRNGIYPLVWETPHYAASQLDYSVVDRIFSTVYERRQTMDLLGSDQLLPYYIPAHGSQNQMIPENLGYIPISDPSPDAVIAGARRNLAVRDGFASFFFHPFVPLDVLKKIVKEIRSMGYTFGNVRLLNNHVATPSQTIASGRAEIKVQLDDQFLDRFTIAPDGKKKDRTTSEQRVSERFTEEVVCPPGWMYVAAAVEEKRLGFPANVWARVSQSQFRIGDYWQSRPLAGITRPVVPVILIDSEAEGEQSVNQMSFIRTFESVGIEYRTLSVLEFFEVPEGVNLVVAPYSAGRLLSEQQVLFILDGVSKGIDLIVEKESSLSERLGIAVQGEEKRIASVRDEYYPQIGIEWRDEGSYRNFEVPVDYVTHYSDQVSGDPIVIGGEYGEGMYLYFATLFDPTTSMGYGRFPYILDMIQRQFDLWPVVKRETAEVYFDPGDREDISVEDLIKLWKQMGFRRIYAAGWHVYPEWTYEYERLIELAHQNAMLVNLWLELPHVNEVFWLDHPEWRERTATGEEAFIGGRQLMALEEPACLEAAFEWISDFIEKYDWDGIHLGEIYFESNDGPGRPDRFTPFYSSVRERYKSIHGFDPVQFFNPTSSLYWRRNPQGWKAFLEFRNRLAGEIQRATLRFLDQKRKQKKGTLDLTITPGGKRLAASLDSPVAEGDNEMLASISVVERLIVVPQRAEERRGPTQYPTGVEFYQAVRDLESKAQRFALYTESSIYEVDLPWIAYVLGESGKETIAPYRWDVESEKTVTVAFDPKVHREIVVDGEIWPAYSKGRAILPPGSHTIRAMTKTAGFFNPLKSTTRLVDISGELLSCKTISRGLEVSYDSPVDCYVVVNEEPQKVLIDEAEVEADVLRGIPGYSIKCPAGSHKARIFTRSSGALSVHNFSLIFSVLIVLVSSLAGTILLMLYIRGRNRRRRIRNGR